MLEAVCFYINIEISIGTIATAIITPFNAISTIEVILPPRDEVRTAAMAVISPTRLCSNAPKESTQTIKPPRITTNAYAAALKPPC